MQDQSHALSQTLAHALAVEPVGRSDAFLVFQERLSRAAAMDRPVLLAGERGTGKELAAARLHYLSPRWQDAFVACNCAALPESLVESELFGHEAGAFTGAQSRRIGRFEAAHGGTLFLDEIASAPMAVQEKILRAVEYGVFERVGGTSPRRADVRVIAASNVDLPALVRAGKFRADLLDRLAFEVLTLPPLRDREGDVELLANHFAARFCVETGLDHGRGAPELSDHALGRLLAHSWPGNVRELKNVVERAVFHAADPEGPGGVDSEGPWRIEDVVLDPFESPYRPPGPSAVQAQAGAQDAEPGFLSAGGPRQQPTRPGQALDQTLGQTPSLGETGSFSDAVRALEVRLLARAMDRAAGRQKRAAALLGLSYDQFRGLYRKYADLLKK